MAHIGHAEDIGAEFALPLVNDKASLFEAGV